MDVKVLKITDEFIFVNKPFGLPSTYKNDEDNSDCAVRQVTDMFPELLSVSGYKNREGGLLYRLDNDTGGLLVFCRNTEKFNHFKVLQDNNKLFKKYLAVVAVNGDENLESLKYDFDYDHLNLVFCDNLYSNLEIYNRFSPLASSNSYKIDFKIIHSRKSKKKMEVVKSRRDSKYVTFFKLCGKKENQLLIEVYIQHGIRHQIRVHLKSVKLGIVNDDLYGTNSIKGREHMALYCSSLYVTT